MTAARLEDIRQRVNRRLEPGVVSDGCIAYFDVPALLDEVQRLRAEVEALYAPPVNAELSAYAFSRYSNDAKLYNGIRDLERRVEQLEVAPRWRTSSMDRISLIVLGRVPTKKNGKLAFGGRVVINPAIKGEIAWITLQLQRQWQRREPLESASVDMCFSVRDGRADLDGKVTTVLDCLVQSGVLRNDSIARVPKISAMAMPSGKDGESVTVSLLELERK